MGYELVLPPDTQSQIDEYITSQFHGLAAQQEAAEAIRVELEKLKANPRLGVSPPGPFERRPIHRFVLDIQGPARTAQVTYKVHEKDQLIVVAGFMGV